MARGGGKTTSRTSIPDRYAYGTKEETERRLEDGYPATESKFSQIRPRDNTTPGGRTFDQKNGAGQGANGPVDRNGDFRPGMRGE